MTGRASHGFIIVIMLMAFLKYMPMLLAVALLATVSGCATIAGVGEEGPQAMPPDTTFPYDRYVEGRPNLDFRVQGGFYLWREGNSWHVRAAEQLDRPRTPSAVWPVMTGKISIENAILADVRQVNIPPLDYARQRRRTISFRFEFRDGMPGGEPRGFDFKVQPTSLDYCVTLEFLVDGVARPGIVHLGSFMHIPETLPLRICLRSFD